MIRFRKNMYTSYSLNKLAKIKWKIRTGAGMFDVYIIAFNHDSRQVEYFHNSLMKQNIFRKTDIDCIGLAKSEAECQEFIEQMLKDCHEKCGSYDLANIYDDSFNNS